MKFSYLRLVCTLAVCVLHTAACGDTKSLAMDAGPVSDVSSVADAKEDTLSSCSWPASLDAAEASTDRCIAARAFVTCTSHGLTETCLSDGSILCSGESAGSCSDACRTDEYAVSCPVSQTPPTGCRTAPGGANPELLFLCCPCST
jgi:hypothetical protein